MPENPSAWLMAVAKNKALGTLRWQRTDLSFAPDHEHMLRTERTVGSVIEDQLALTELARLFKEVHAGTMPSDAAPGTVP